MLVRNNTSTWYVSSKQDRSTPQSEEMVSPAQTPPSAEQEESVNGSGNITQMHPEPQPALVGAWCAAEEPLVLEHGGKITP